MQNRLTPTVTKYFKVAGYVILITISVIYIIRTGDVIQFEGGDNAYYLFLGKAIAEGIGYRDTFLPGSPPNVHFPPFFPLLIALEIKLFGLNIYIIKLMLSLFAASSLIVTPTLLSRYDFKTSFLPGIFFGCSYIYFYHCDQFLTEPIFTASLFLSLLFFEIYLSTGKKGHLILSILFCGSVVMTRTAGLALVGALPVAYLLAKEKNIKNFVTGILFFVILILPFFLWSVRNKLVAGETSSYLNQFMLIDPYDPTMGKITPYYFAVRILDAVRFYFTDTTESIIYSSYGLPKPLSLGIAGLFWALFLVGFIKKCITRITAVEIFTLAFLFITLSWPFRGYRFLMPAYLFLLAYIIHGAVFITSFIKWKILSIIILVFLEMLFILCFLVNLRDSYDYYRYAKKGESLKVAVGEGVFVFTRPQYQELGRMLEAALWLKNNMPSDGVTLTRKPSLVALAGVKKVIGPEPIVPANPVGWLYKNQVKYILVDELLPDIIDFMRSLTKGQSLVPGIKIIYQNENTYIIETDLPVLIQQSR